jgi:hypothetical protein
MGTDASLAPTENLKMPYHFIKADFDFGDENYCGTGLMAEVTYVDAKGKRKTIHRLSTR